jgi:hypothetical protein
VRAGVLKPSREMYIARTAMPTLKLTTGSSAFLVIPITSDYQLPAPSVPLVVLFRLVKIRIACTAGSESTLQFIEMGYKVKSMIHGCDFS